MSELSFFIHIKIINFSCFNVKVRFCIILKLAIFLCYFIFQVDPEYQTHDKNKTDQSQRAANSAASSGGGSSLPNSATKKRTEKFGKSKTTSITHKPITQFNVDDDKSSPYAFDFDSPDAVTPQVPHFRKSASPLKPTPPATHTPTTTGGQMLKRSKASLSGFISDPSTSGWQFLDPVLSR